MHSEKDVTLNTLTCVSRSKCEMTVCMVWTHKIIERWLVSKCQGLTKCNSYKFSLEHMQKSCMAILDVNQWKYWYETWTDESKFFSVNQQRFGAFSQVLLFISYRINFLIMFWTKGYKYLIFYGKGSKCTFAK